METALRELVYNYTLEAAGLDATNAFFIEGPQATAIDPILVYSIITNPMNRDTLKQFDEYFLQFSAYGKDLDEVETMIENICFQWDYATDQFKADLLAAGYQWAGQYRQHRDSFKDDADYWHNLVRYKFEVSKLAQVESLLQVGTPAAPGLDFHFNDFSAETPLTEDFDLSFDYYCNHATGDSGPLLLGGGVQSIALIGACSTNLDVSLQMLDETSNFNVVATGNGALVLDDWNTIRLTRVGDLFTLYVNSETPLVIDTTGWTLIFQLLSLGGTPFSNIYTGEKIRNFSGSPFFIWGRAEQFSGGASVVGGPVFKILNLGSKGSEFNGQSSNPANQFILESYK